jgi:hypothetical protein
LRGQDSGHNWQTTLADTLNRIGQSHNCPGDEF